MGKDDCLFIADATIFSSRRTCTCIDVVSIVALPVLAQVSSIAFGSVRRGMQHVRI
jgi:hypothetical protein